METKSLTLSPEEQERFKALPPITKKQQALIDAFAMLMIEQYMEEKNG